MQCELRYLLNAVPLFKQAAGGLVPQVMKMQPFNLQVVACPRESSPYAVQSTAQT